MNVPSEKGPFTEVDSVVIKTNCRGGKLNPVPRLEILGKKNKNNQKTTDCNEIVITVMCWEKVIETKTTNRLNGTHA